MYHLEHSSGLLTYIGEGLTAVYRVDFEANLDVLTPRPHPPPPPPARSQAVLLLWFTKVIVSIRNRCFPFYLLVSSSHQNLWS